MSVENEYDVIVVGAGHAGCEAALAAARMGCRALLLTLGLDRIAEMPCNPSVGGPAKGQLTREIGALGGEQARNIDRTFIQIRLLNQSKGPAVHALRAQADRRLYSLTMRKTLEGEPRLDLKEGMVAELLVRGTRVRGVQTSEGQQYLGKAVVLTTGTFLNGRLTRGRSTWPGGRVGEDPAVGLSLSLMELGFSVERLKTDTPPRVDARTIDFSQTKVQLGSEEPLHFSFSYPEAGIQPPPPLLGGHEPNTIYPLPLQTGWRPQLPCYLVCTNRETHKIILDNLHRAPLYNGTIEAEGPRYCPSIEIKVPSFPDKESHQLFLEPEGWRTNQVYVQGAYTSLPEDVQLAMLRTIPALRDVEVIHFGYAVEYDYVPSSQLSSSLETKLVEGLFHAGQINGTSGYEEAASQGIMAGINAARKVHGQPPVVLRRDQAYIGVLIDDLTTKEICQPYRMMTSRAEYRLLLRQDNADLRLSPIGYEVGLLDRVVHEAVERKRRSIDEELSRLRNTWIRPTSETNELLATWGLPSLHDGVNALQFLRRPEVSYEMVETLRPNSRPLPPDAAYQVATEAKYAGYIDKQCQQVERMRRLEERHIPDSFDYDTIVGVRKEAQEKLKLFRPATVGQASRISGVNPADISILLVYLERARRGQT
ncbi:MAG: tRNA uridine-5-carboxymethylaminomethyl(34) synthesis enzyme MnmG [Anaerolineae bacterium]|nr:tRNA uridine-5-carboxymethylaminomethyl(34) synthesis enzyme MnmG [Anaerolineae bacterium]NIN94635.1 tRNA uridine-5-carboxymethylaminomethyl(34) synthesis enzyme MnmG [Anaerolineae bacterium]NIQ77695.1 tRNA uridine-5-carboxymethylaminomethyl(34) synthesis enzyme MnmG [Anaerolineae bacterium]